MSRKTESGCKKQEKKEKRADIQESENTNNPAKPRTIIRKEKTAGQLPAERIGDIIDPLSILRGGGRNPSFRTQKKRVHHEADCFIYDGLEL